MIELATLADLDRKSATRLAEALEGGLLSPPFGALALQTHVSEAQVQAISTLLSGLAAQQMSPWQIALVLRAHIAGRQADRDVPRLEIVISGPDVAATARDTGVVMRQMFSRAKERVLAVGFAVKQGHSIFRSLAERLEANQSLEAVLCIDVRRQQSDTSLESQVVARFAKHFVENEWPGSRLPSVYYDPRSVAPIGSTRSALHAKCVVIDGYEALVTSANFTEAAQERNIELGLLVRSIAVVGQIEQHFTTLIQEGFLRRLPLP